MQPRNIYPSGCRAVADQIDIARKSKTDVVENLEKTRVAIANRDRNGRRARARRRTAAVVAEVGATAAVESRSESARQVARGVPVHRCDQAMLVRKEGSSSERPEILFIVQRVRFPSDQSLASRSAASLAPDGRRCVGTRANRPWECSPEINNPSGCRAARWP